MTPSSATPAISQHALVIIKNRDVAKIFAEFLAELGCTVSLAGNVQAGFTLAELRKPSLAFCDLRLSDEMDGLDFAKRIRLDRNFDHLLLTALMDFDHPQACLLAHRAGFDQALVKPVRFLTVKNLVIAHAQSQVFQQAVAKQAIQALHRC